MNLWILTMKAIEEKGKIAFCGRKVQNISKPHNFKPVIRCDKTDSYLVINAMNACSLSCLDLYPFTPVDVKCCVFLFYYRNFKIYPAMLLLTKCYRLKEMGKCQPEIVHIYFYKRSS